MRSYFFSADTQEDMLGWVRALSQSASMETDGSLNRYTGSFGTGTAARTAVADFVPFLSGAVQVTRISQR